MGEDYPAAVPGGLAAGSRLAGYLLEEQIGQGGMAVVFRALDVRLNRQVALKALTPALAADEAFRQRFIRESQAAAAVDDPHIIPVFEAGDASGVLFIAMRLVRGGDVGTLVRQGGPLPPGRAVAIISPVAAALDAAHEAGLVHRDVKPANMLLDARPGRPEHVYLSDFGLSKTALASSGLTGTGQFLGTLDYIAPEQIEGQPVDGRADQYALAAAAFELLTGAPPFQRHDAMAVMYAQLSQPPPALTSRQPGFPQAADAVFARALAKSPADRYQSCREFSEAMRAAFGIGPYDCRAVPGPGIGRPATEVVAAPAAASPASDRGGILAGAAAGRSGGGSSAPTEAVWLSPVSTRPEVPGYVPQRRPQRHSFTWAAVIVAIAALAGAVAIVVNRAAAPTPENLLNPRSAAASGSCRARPVSGHPNWSASQSSRPLLELGRGERNVTEGIAFSPDGTTLAVSTFGGTTYLISAATGGISRTLADPGSRGVEAVAFSCNGKLIATGDANGSTYLWDLAPGGPAAPQTLTSLGSKAIRAVAFSPDGTMLATGSKSGSAYLWSVRSGSAARLAATLTAPAGSNIQAVAFSPRGTMLAAGDAEGSTYLWPVRSGAPAAPSAILTDPASRGVQALAFSPSGALLAAGDANGSTYLWNVAPGQQHSSRTLADPGARGGYGTVAVAFSPDGTMLAAGGYTGQTYLWNTATASVIASLPDPHVPIRSDDVQAVAFGPNGTTLTTGNTQGGVYLWTAG